ncbi:peptide ABC transporter permease [Marinitoga sp. 1135]|uniref:ABC transporter permease n=1 Tax=unclassified Marinitoga TaxID=2640159 RepID=UPI0015865FCF|nr:MULTISPECIES: ABC transporter permease [unclassified Marinitoga]NUU95660.1 peptide ABC transporter permease [Marinitoga sp. 1135]NUU97581.1 peptide ABC transporter permease [Marinitoga sp. 1138]
MKEWLKNHEGLYYTFTNRRVIFGSIVLIFFVLLAIIGPMIAKFDPLDTSSMPYSPPNPTNWLGTTTFGHDIFSQLVYGLRSSLYLGIIGGGIATIVGLIIGFISGYLGGFSDEFLMMITNIMMVIPTMALLIIIAAYLPYRGVTIESIIIGLTSWPWTARAVRSQTLSLKSREFVQLAKITAVKPMKIVFKEIAPNMMSYVFMVFILQFGGAILSAIGLDFIGLGPTRGVSLGTMLQQAVLWSAIQLKMWWWVVPPGLVITIFVGTLFYVNTGLDEAFNPRLRKQ